MEISEQSEQTLSSPSSELATPTEVPSQFSSLVNDINITMETSQAPPFPITTVAMPAVIPPASMATTAVSQIHQPGLQPVSVPTAKTPAINVATGSGHHTTRYLPTPDLSGSCERRSSKRSIKRKRFDDEVVESSLLKQERPTRDRKGEISVLLLCGTQFILKMIV